MKNAEKVAYKAQKIQSERVKVGQPINIIEAVNLVNSDCSNNPPENIAYKAQKIQREQAENGQPINIIEAVNLVKNGIE